ncbi:WYL domain-containing protein [Streptacidiphilus sp. PAMC 29251]
MDGTQIVLGYAGPRKPADVRTVHPLGLVAKAGVWYLVAGTDDGLRTFRLSRITSVEPTGEPVARPDGFDLAAVWRTLATQVEERMLTATVQARADVRSLPILEELFGGRLRIGDPLAGDQVEIEVAGPSPEIIAAQLAGLGPRVEILSPASAREWLASLAAELARMYWPSTTVEDVTGRTER